MIKPVKKLLLFLFYTSIIVFLLVYKKLHLKLPIVTFYDLAKSIEWYDEKVKEWILYRTQIRSALAENDIEVDNIWHDVMHACIHLLLTFSMHFYVLYVLLLRYFTLFDEIFALLKKVLHKCDWKLPLNILKFSYRIIVWLVNITLYYNSILPVNYRLVVYGMIITLTSVRSVKDDVYLSLVPIFSGVCLYFVLIYTLNPIAVNIITAILERFVLFAWLIISVVQYYLNINTLNYKYVADLYLISTVSKGLKLLPLIGNVLIKSQYLAHATCILTTIILIHSFIVYLSDHLIPTPVERFKIVFINIFDYVIFHSFGWSRQTKDDSRREGAIIGKLFNQLNYVLKLAFGKMLKSLQEKQSVAIALKLIKTLPQLSLVLLPSIVSNLYFYYHATLVPIIKYVTDDDDYIALIITFIVADFTRFLYNNVRNLIPFTTLLRIALVLAMDFTVDSITDAIEL